MDTTGRPNRRQLWILVSAILLLSPVLLASQDSVADEFEAVLAESENLSVRDVARRLAALGPAAIPLILDGLQATSHEFRPSERKRTLELALGYVPAPDLDAALRLTALGEVELGARIRAIRILGIAGKSGSIDLVLAIAGEMTKEQLASASNQGSVRTALVKILERDSSGWSRLEQGMRSAPPPIRKICLTAARESRSPRGIELLGRLLSVTAKPDVELLLAIASSPSINPQPVSLGARSRVQVALGNEAVEVRRAAALAAGRLHCSEATHRLIELLEDEDRLVRGAALGALRRISGHRMGFDLDRWEIWEQLETQWLDERLNPDLDILANGKAIDILKVLPALGRRRLHREEFVEAVAALLTHDEVGVRRTSAEILEKLGSPTVLPELRRALEDEDEGVRIAADSALAAITGVEAPEDPAGWAEILER